MADVSLSFQEEQRRRAVLEAELERLARLPSSSLYASHRIKVVRRALELLSLASQVECYLLLAFHLNHRSLASYPPCFSVGDNLSLCPSLGSNAQLRKQLSWISFSLACASDISSFV